MVIYILLGNWEMSSTQIVLTWVLRQCTAEESFFSQWLVLSPITSAVKMVKSMEGAEKRKVVVQGTAGGIGQPLALLMKLNPLVS
eukprot:Gb_14820 [translate_table: standard]